VLIQKTHRKYIFLNKSYLAAALIVRGKLEISDLRRNITRIRKSVRFVEWNSDGWKTGFCSVQPLLQSSSLLLLANNSCAKDTIKFIMERFRKLYRKKVNPREIIM
jgi:tubulin epsilon